MREEWNRRERRERGGTGEPGEEFDALTHEVIGAAIEVHRHLGPGYVESVYVKAMAVEMALRGLVFERERPIYVKYKGHDVGEGRMDYFVNQCLLVELKAVDQLAPIHKAQVISYLLATGCHIGLLINFNVQLLRHGIQRIILSPTTLGVLGALGGSHPSAPSPNPSTVSPTPPRS